MTRSMKNGVNFFIGMIHSSKIQHKGASFQLRGLTNCGNSCYVNAVLQALIACPPFFNLLRSLAPAVVSRTKGTSTPVLDSLLVFLAD